MYGFIIPAKGMELLTGLLAGDTLTITRCMVGTGQVPAETQPTALTDLVQPIAQATSTQPLVHGKQVDFTIQYRNDLHGGLENGFYLREFGVFARDKSGAEVMIYYGNLGGLSPVGAAIHPGRGRGQKFPRRHWCQQRAHCNSGV